MAEAKLIDDLSFLAGLVISPSNRIDLESHIARGYGTVYLDWSPNCGRAGVLSPFYVFVISKHCWRLIYIGKLNSISRVKSEPDDSQLSVMELYDCVDVSGLDVGDLRDVVKKNFYDKAYLCRKTVNRIIKELNRRASRKGAWI